MRKRSIATNALAVGVTLLAAGTALANSGHFLEGGNHTPVCRDIGTQVACTGKVAGLGGTTFEIVVVADGLAEVECVNPGGNVAPGQDTEVTTDGTSDELPTPRNGQYRFGVMTLDPEPLPPTPTCPNSQWTPDIIDVEFTTATLYLYENGVLSDQITVSVE